MFKILHSFSKYEYLKAELYKAHPHHSRQLTTPPTNTHLKNGRRLKLVIVDVGLDLLDHTVRDAVLLVREQHVQELGGVGEQAAVGVRVVVDLGAGLVARHPLRRDLLHDAHRLHDENDARRRTLHRLHLRHVVLVQRLEAGQRRLQRRQRFVQVALRVIGDRLRLFRLLHRLLLVLLHHDARLRRNLAHF